MKFISPFWPLLGGLATSSCATFTTELNSTLVSEAVAPGLIYRLPAKQFSLTTAFLVTDCKVNGNKVELDADVEATLSERLVGAEAYTISYSDLDAWTKITNTEFRLSEAGLLTGINAGLADQTGTVFSNSVETATGIARAVSLPSAVLNNVASLAQAQFAFDVERTQSLLQQNQLRQAATRLNDLKSKIAPVGGDTDWLFPSIKPGTLSKPELQDKLQKVEVQVEQAACIEVNTLLKQHKDAKTALKTEQAKDKERDLAKRQKGEAEAEIDRLQALKDVYKALGKEEAKDGLIARIQEQEKRQVEAASNLDRLGVSGTNKASEALASATAALTITATNDTLPRKLGDSLEVTVSDNDIPPALKNSFELDIPKLPKVTLTIDTFTASESTLPNPNLKGVVYRIPVAGITRVYCECTNGTRLLIEHPTQVPQLGPVGRLDLKNGAFANNNLEVVFSVATGAPEKLMFHSKSRAEEASASARDAANSYLQLQKDRRDDIIAANKAAISQQTELLALEKDRSDVSLANAQSAAAAALIPITTEKSLVNAQVDLLRDQQRLDAVRTGSASTAEIQLEALINQQKLLEQQLKILQIEQQIAEQKSKGKIGSTP
ncbi:MAG: hypothetical protein NVV73_07335 [Cellvibrionaceae bacterium]|nr:hypothetical protein [Cellvibrionaceae bacterium]